MPESNQYFNNSSSDFTIKPKLKGFFLIYLLTSIPKIISSVFVMLIIIVLFLISIFALLSGGSKSKNTIQDLNFITTKDNKHPDKKVLIYNLNGAIQSGKAPSSSQKNGGIFVDSVREDFEQIKNDSSIKNIVFKFNSPGGEVFASEILGDLLNDLLNNKNQKIGIFYFDSISASGALFATYKVPNNFVFASKYGQTGSIGVRQEIPNIAGLAEKVGYKQFVIKSGESKDIGSPFRDPTIPELAYFQKEVDTIYARFTGIVASGRKLDIEKVKPISNGYVYFNDIAKSYGLVDELDTNTDNAVKKAAQNAGIENSFNTVELERPATFLESIGISTNFLNINLNANIPGSEKLQGGGENATFKMKNGVNYLIDESKI